MPTPTIKKKPEQDPRAKWRANTRSGTQKMLVGMGVDKTTLPLRR